MEIAHKITNSSLFSRRKQSKIKNGFPDSLAKLEAPLITTSSPSVDTGHSSSSITTPANDFMLKAANGVVSHGRVTTTTNSNKPNPVVERLHVDYVPSWKPDRRFSSPAVRNYRRSPSPRRLYHTGAYQKSKGSISNRGLNDSYRNRACSLPDAGVRRASSARTERDWKENGQQRSPYSGRAEQRFLQLPESSEYDKLRSFGINKKGELVDQGYCYRHRSDTSSSESVNNLSASPSDPDSPLNRIIEKQDSANMKKYQICVIGANDVGKTSLINQFQNCELANIMGRGDSLEGETERILSILIGGVEVELCFNEVDVTLREIKTWQPSSYTGVIVLYTVTSRRSFSVAADALYRLRCGDNMQNNLGYKILDEDVPLFLVGNKIDLERQRVIQDNEGKELAKSYDCKFMEISVGLGHKTDDLLKTLLLEIRKLETDKSKPQRRKSSFCYKKRKSMMATVTARKPRANSLHNVPIFGSLGRRLARSCEDMIARLWKH